MLREERLRLCVPRTASVDALESGDWVQARRLAAQRQGQQQERLRRERERAEEAQQRQRDARVRLITPWLPLGAGRASVAPSRLRWNGAIVLVLRRVAACPGLYMHDKHERGCTTVRGLHPGDCLSRPLDLWHAS